MRHAHFRHGTFPGRRHGLTVHRYGRPLAPAGDAQAEREFGRFHLAAVDPYLETYLLVEGVLRPLGDRHPYAAGHFGRDVAGRVDHRGQPAVVGGIPQVLRELGPSLVHVRRAAGIARQQAVEDVRAVVALLEIAAVVGNHHLVDLLVVLAGVIGVRGLRGQGVERHALQMVGELHVARDFGHLLQRVHHLHGRAKLRTLRRGGAVQRLGQRGDAARGGEFTFDFVDIRTVSRDHAAAVAEDHVLTADAYGDEQPCAGDGRGPGAVDHRADLPNVLAHQL